MSRIRLFAAAVVAFLLCASLTEKTFGATGDVIDTSINLGMAIADSAGDS